MSTTTVLVTSSSLDHSFSTTVVFFGSGIGMALEVLFKKITGRKVSGPLGKIWFCGLLLFLGKNGMESW